MHRNIHSKCVRAEHTGQNQHSTFVVQWSGFCLRGGRQGVGPHLVGSGQAWDLHSGTVATALSGAWHCRVSTRNGWPGVCRLWPGEIASWTCQFYLSVAACRNVSADLSLRYTLHVAETFSSWETTADSAQERPNWVDALWPRWHCFGRRSNIRGSVSMMTADTKAVTLHFCHLAVQVSSMLLWFMHKRCFNCWAGGTFHKASTPCVQLFGFVSQLFDENRWNQLEDCCSRVFERGQQSHVSEKWYCCNCSRRILTVFISDSMWEMRMDSGVEKHSGDHQKAFLCT